MKGYWALAAENVQYIAVVLALVNMGQFLQLVFYFESYTHVNKTVQHFFECPGALLFVLWVLRKVSQAPYWPWGAWQPLPVLSLQCLSALWLYNGFFILFWEADLYYFLIGVQLAWVLYIVFAVKILTNRK